MHIRPFNVILDAEYSIHRENKSQKGEKLNRKTVVFRFSEKITIQIVYSGVSKGQLRQKMNLKQNTDFRSGDLTKIDFSFFLALSNIS